MAALAVVSVCVGGRAVLAAPAAAVRVVVTISARPEGHSLPPAFIGLAVENWTLTKDQFQGSNLGEYLRAIGPRGLLRIGGNSLDESLWTSHREPRPAWATQGVATPASLRTLAVALRSAGWRVILGVNLRHYDPGRAVDEASYAARILGPELAAIEPGNEPDHYGISEATYLQRFRGYARALHAALPAVRLVGPDAASGDTAWLRAFARQQAGDRQISLLTFHNYPESACRGNRPTIADLLSLRDWRREKEAADAAVSDGAVARVPAIIDETNSAVCWGAPGTSNVFASALWTLDYTLLLAHEGLAEVNFQGRIAGCAEYSPLCTVGNGRHLMARPDFYGLLAALQVTPGRFLTLADPDAASLRAYAVSSKGGSLSVILDNLGGPTTVTVRLPRHSYHSVSETTLQTSSPLGLTSTSTRGITLGGRQITPNGVLQPPRYRRVKLDAGSFTVAVKAGSAAIVKVS
ncbi:MAG TPA: hypothetical protein VHV75_11990 [Solirubrobacteraceae bacterium]|nr:hypothetical protein [Solirubrobacteraceae bacterium]